ncbi:MAG TPA: hypothetical protein VMW52_01040 [Phycisphaerae bacterium]|nr:hypothetical protein [Phycisphaerae bacterium]
MAVSPYVTLREAARRLGLSASTLRRLGWCDGLFAPAVEGVPGLIAGLPCYEGIGSRITRYHVEQLRFIQAVLLREMNIEEAALRWNTTKKRLAAEGVGLGPNPCSTTSRTRTATTPTGGR